ncbi:hypothetical protein Pla22_50800 [Rubripirellula amarantea]|uniref:Uncharacterized protein n=1 Tax=Rubripirellula amarantea TaxID=2527999 RepID=A0A5C5WBP9_9BACT|nr:hypothetical protein [Rubripirellula amarantea]TWT48080.1 hypothetical protein Pla22_50800 [Rubripirellula amarantea]
MHLPHIHPADRSRLKRWATQQATICTLVFLVVSLLGAYSRPPGYAEQSHSMRDLESSNALAWPSETDAPEFLQTESQDTDTLYRETLVTESQEPSMREVASYAYVPEGWRRTSQGWEFASDWHDESQYQTPVMTKSINRWIEVQKNREPHWVQATLDAVRRLPPLTFAILQVAAVAVAISITSTPKPQQDTHS